MTPASARPPNSAGGKDARGLLGLLGHVDRVLEADQRVEGQRRAADDQQRHRVALLELEHPARVAAAVGEEGRADHDDEHQAAHLDQRADDVEAHGLLDPAEVDRGDHADEDQADEHGRQVDELRQVVAAERRRQRAGRRHAGGHHREGDHEGEEGDLEGAVDVERRAGRLRVLGHQLRVRRGGEHREHPGEREGRPDRAADLTADLADERVDPAAEDVADDEQQQHLAADALVQRRADARAAGAEAGAAAERRVWRGSAHGGGPYPGAGAAPTAARSGAVSPTGSRSRAGR